MEFLVEHSIYVTLIIAGVILLGILLYLSRIDARLRSIEKENHR